MESNGLIVVADKFVDFTADKKVVTLSQLKAMLGISKYVFPGPVRLLCGQGLSDENIIQLIARIGDLDPEQSRWDTSHLRANPARANSSLSHKRDMCNTLICAPKQISEDRFHIDISIDQNCELMGDHQSGQHVQGMVLVEASRQSFLAVTEKFFPMENGEKTYFVIGKMAIDFFAFMFPVGAHIEYRIISKDINERRQKFNVEMDIIQNDIVKMQTEYSFTVYPDSLISKKEANLAYDAANFVLSSVGHSGQHMRVA